jgi:hypothetical protein
MQNWIHYIKTNTHIARLDHTQFGTTNELKDAWSRIQRKFQREHQYNDKYTRNARKNVLYGAWMAAGRPSDWCWKDANIDWQNIVWSDVEAVFVIHEVIAASASMADDDEIAEVRPLHAQMDQEPNARADPEQFSEPEGNASGDSEWIEVHLLNTSHTALHELKQVTSHTRAPNCHHCQYYNITRLTWQTIKAKRAVTKVTIHIRAPNCHHRRCHNIVRV